MTTDTHADPIVPMGTPFVPLALEIERNVIAALAEDIGSGDLSAGLIAAGKRVAARVLCREQAVVCGQPWFDKVFAIVDPTVRVRWRVPEGSRVTPDTVVCEVRGRARSIVTAERSGINFLQVLSAVASETRLYADALAGTRTRIVDTRKTLPGLRLAQKYAVRIGGGANHRLGLYDAYLVKENHIVAARGLTAAIRTALERLRPPQWLQVEVETLDQLREAIAAGAPHILLDNMTDAQMAEAVRVTAGRAILEASGSITLARVKRLARIGIDRISSGALTKHVRAVDYSMRFDGFD